MIPLQYGERELFASPGETVLEALERAGLPVSSSCRAGVCQSCLVRATRGKPPAPAQVGLKQSQKEQGYFLACLCRPADALAFVPACSAAFCTTAEIVEKQTLGLEVVRIRLRTTDEFRFRAGQFVTLRRADGLARSYSIASLPSTDGAFDIHVRRIPNGRMSGWLCDVAETGADLELDGPKGDCFYTVGDPSATLTLVGTGTGIAPLAAIVEDALRSGHTGEIRLYQGAISADRLYDVERLERMADAFPNLSYRRCVLRGEPAEGMRVGALDEIATKELSDPKRQRVFLCGDPSLVNTLRKRFFLSGVSMKHIFADPFVGTEASPPTPAPAATTVPAAHASPTLN